MAPLRDLELMIQSHYPLIAIETFEEARLERILAEVATSLRVPFFVWSVTTGLKRYGSLNSIYDSQTPVKALNNVAAMPGEGLFLFKDLHRYFDKPEIVRKLQDLAPSFKMDRRVIVLSATQLALPAELQALAGVFTLDLPGPDELKAIAQRVVADLSRQRPIRVDLTPADFDQLVDRMRGFTELEAERAITKTVLRDSALTRSGLEAMVEIKKELLQKEGILEYIAPEENLAEVGGFSNLKTWLAKRKRAFAPEAKRFGLATPRGILLLGVQGAGKTLVARAIAREWELPLLKMETGRLYDKYIGESEKNLDRALRTAEQMAPCVLMIDELEKALSYSASGDSDAGLSKRISSDGSSAGSRTGRRPSSWSPPQTISPSCRPSSRARAASTRSSSWTCRTPRSARRSSPSTCASGGAIPPLSTSIGWRPTPRASPAPRSSRPSSPGSIPRSRVRSSSAPTSSSTS